MKDVVSFLSLDVAWEYDRVCVLVSFPDHVVKFVCLSAWEQDCVCVRRG